jgi:hypothetical protein
LNNCWHGIKAVSGGAGTSGEEKNKTERAEERLLKITAGLVLAKETKRPITCQYQSPAESIRLSSFHRV